MIKPSMEHVNAICHAEFFLEGCIGKVPEPHMRHQMEKDLLRLAELKLYLIQRMVDTKNLYQVEDKDRG